MKNYYVSVGSYELCIATNATCDEMEGEFIATCLDTGDRLFETRRTRRVGWR